MKNIDVLKLEVETDPPAGTLANLVENPDGAQGAWGWVTPVANTTLVSSNTPHNPCLQYNPVSSGANFFYTDPYPVTVGQVIGAGWVVQACNVGAGNGWYRVSIEFLNSSFVLLSATTPTAYLQEDNSGGRAYLASATIPASTVYARLRFDMYSSNAGAVVGTSNAFMTVHNAAMVTAASAGALSVISRRNKVTNPSFEVNTTGWLSSTGSPTVARSTTQAFVGTASCSMTATQNYDMRLSSSVGTGGMPVVAGVSYTAKCRFRAATTSRQVQISIFWYAPSGAPINSGGAGAAASDSNAGWIERTSTEVAPAGAAFAAVTPYVRSALTGEVHYVDAVQFEVTATSGAYFDGDTTDPSANQLYAWDGTAHNATSTFTEYAPYSDGAWTDILGPTHEIRLLREDLNVGTLTATVLDEALDPATASLLRPGRKVRLRALDASTALYTSLFEGRATEAEVTYDLHREDSKQARISLTAADNIRQLANVSRNQGVGSVSDLRYLMEGAGVPWLVNGNSNQASSATVVAVNENASLLDQIAITRDSALGYAWVNRAGVLVANDAPFMSSGTNLVPNPSFETNTTGWTAGANTTITRVTTQFLDGIASLSVNRVASGNISVSTPSGTSGMPVTAGKSYGAQCSMLTNAGARNFTITLNWYTSGGGLVSSDVSPMVLNGTSWMQNTFQATAPATAAFAQIVVTVISPSDLGPHYLDMVRLFEVNLVDESVYSDLDVSFNTNTCINDVRVKWLRYNATTGSTDEITYGPYRDAASVQEWGYHSAEFTVQGASESSAAIAAYANDILAASGTPVVRINSIQIPINSAADVTVTKALLDLYDLVRVSNTAKGLDHTSRITGIEHQITSDRWLMNLSFSVEGAVASPQVTPSPGTGSGVTAGVLDVAHGGTGLTSVTAGNFLSGNGTSPLSQRTPTQVKADLGIKGGAITVTTDASGVATITHGLGGTPAFVVATTQGTSTYFCTITSKGATTFTVTVLHRDASGGFLVSSPIPINWFAGL